MNRTSIKDQTMTMIETWPVAHTEQTPVADERKPAEALPVTPEEEDAWLEKLKQLAGCVA